MTPIKRGTARRLGLRTPQSLPGLAWVDEVLGFDLDPWQRHFLERAYASDKPLKFDYAAASRTEWIRRHD